MVKNINDALYRVFSYCGEKFANENDKAFEVLDEAIDNELSDELPF